jgi:solute carrier family 13 (sodium-dependent dicarboxylate transporter), member 2/3/5
VQNRYKELGPITFHQAAVLVNFTILVMLWFFRKPQFIPGNMNML